MLDESSVPTLPQESQLNNEVKQEPLDASFYEDKADRAKAVLSKEFKREIEEREKQVIAIQEKIQEAQKCIQLLTYVAACDYYEVKEETKGDDKQNWDTAIHPCVKKLLPDPLNPEAGPSKVTPFEEPLCCHGPKDDTPKRKPNLTIVRGTYRFKHQLVIGNVSKSIDLREDEATHKWMLYVRLKNGDDDLGKIIKKVRYFLHDSYKPDNIIDVTTPPFHLTRRGWGEFPVRATIFFQHAANKPVDIVHQLKLDQTYSGRQMLGGETVIELNLFHDDVENVEEGLPNKSPVKTGLTELIANEHDYCSNAVKIPEIPRRMVQATSMNPPVEEVSELKILEKWSQGNGSIGKWYLKNVAARAANIFFCSTEACVKWLLKKWPIITVNALNERYKTVHPYTFPNTADFCRVNIGRKRAAEWFRATKIYAVLNMLELSPWSVKQIMLYARMHGYVFYIGIPNYLPSDLKNISTYTSTIDTTTDLRMLESQKEEDEIDIVGEAKEVKTPSPVKQTKTVTIVSELIKFVNITSREIGVKLHDEEIVSGVKINATSAVLAKALSLFIEDLIRKSCCNAWLRNQRKLPGMLEVEDILKTLIESPQFDILTNMGLGKRNT